MSESSLDIGRNVKSFARRCIAPGSWVLIILVLSYSNPSLAQVDFARDIKPILSSQCFQCHGPDENAREADLRFDSTRDQFNNVIGDGENSELLKRILTDDPEEMMPPPSSKKKKLTKEQARLLEVWIAQGAKVTKHWSYEPIQRPIVPRVRNTSWVKNAIDRFVLAKLESKGLAPQRPADKATLTRRLCLDLIGLPSASAISDMNLDADAESSEQIESLIDQLLASPAFGEKMAIEWLDLVRYADTCGIHSDNPISMSPYRDYVINAFNSNMPFDQFTKEQLAGDLIPNPSLQQKVASAYNRLNMMTTEGGAQDREYLAKYAADRVRTTSVTWLGSTLGCAECHDHKYDPFSTRDFYQFAAFFADITEKGYYPGAESSGDWGPKLEIPSNAQLTIQKNIEREIGILTERLQRQKVESLKELSKWEEKTRRQVNWNSVEWESVIANSKTQLARQQDGSYLAKGKRADTDVYSASTKKIPKRIQAIRLDVIPDSSLPGKGPGRAGNGNFVLTEIKLELKKKGKSSFAKFSQAYSTFDQILAGEHTPYKKWHALSAIDNDKHGPKPGWAILPKINQVNSAIFVLEKAVEGNLIDEMIIHLEQKHDNPGHVIGRFKLSYLDQYSKDVLSGLSTPLAVRAALDKEPESRTPEQRKAIEEFFIENDSAVVQIKNELAKQQKRLNDEKKKWITVLTTVSRKPREMRILPRGNWLDESGPIVTSQLPAFLAVSKNSNPNSRLTRMDLADWIVSPNNPLTARVQVNRLWKKMFGRGLVSTMDDFGSQGNVPSHPALLDFLAIEFMESGWDIKHMVKLIAGSATYQQSSRSDSKSRLGEIDPNNEWLARQNSFRVEAEVVRDQALAASGLMVNELGGPSTKPYQPSGYYQHLNFPRRTYAPDRGGNQYRKGIYTHWQRLFLHPSMLAFDAPSREECTAERVRSNTPQQALVLLNDPSFVEAARVFAARIMASGDSSEARIRFAFLAALGRKPTARELAVVQRVYSRSLEDAKSDNARDILAVGFSKQDSGLELVAWTSVARVIFNLHEFTTRY